VLKVVLQGGASLRQKQFLGFVLLLFVLSALSGAQSQTDLAALKGLAPVSALPLTAEGKAALAANFIVTGGIQTGTIRQATLLPFAEQQQQALRDAAITDGNLAQLADGLGTALGSAYVARAHYTGRNGRSDYTSISPAVAELIAYTTAVTARNSRAGKYFFANATTNGEKPVTAEAAAILKANGGVMDVFGRTYHLAAGTPGANAYGNSRPFQTEPSVLPVVGPDYFDVPSGNVVYNRGPVMDLINSPSYPSGHTTYGYTGSLLLAILIPSRYQQMIVRGAEYGNDRILMGAHYAMDVLGGRTLALYDMAHLLANDPAYVHLSDKTMPDFRGAVKQARSDVDGVLSPACGKTVEVCAGEDTSRFSDAAADGAFYLDTQTYGLPVVYPQYAHELEDVSAVAPEAGYLLTVAFPTLTLEQADRLLTETEGPGGGFLDDGSAFGVYSRLNLYAAAGRAAAGVGTRP
jgi:hypothetical protein